MKGTRITFSARSFRLPIVAASFVSLFLFFLAPAASAVSIDWVTVGDPGNPADTAFNCIAFAANCGSVAEEFRISKFEVTNAQYADFLNEKAASDPLGLYNLNMGSRAEGGITRTGSSGSFTYAVKSGFENKPVNFVSFFDSLRFANWLNNGQGSGDTETGAYTLLGFTATPSNGDTVTRNAGASIFLPSENEWFKAAYWDPGTQSFLDFPAGSNSETVCAAPSATANTANCDFAVGNVTDVGAYTNSASPNGTFDQGGNVWEWNEEIVDGSVRGIRGGSFVDGVGSAAFGATGSFAASEFGNDGFRVASTVPKPIEWVTVGDPGNPADTASNCFAANCGSVAEAYRISKFEVTNAQYVEFLNEKAAADPLGLYNSNMSSSAQGGITRSGSSGSFTYAVRSGFENKPVNFVSFYDSLRFANWLNNGQESGDTETGAYTLLGFTATPSNGDMVTRNAGANIFLPSENEWYKAAYYDALSASYFNYPAGTDTQTVCAAPGASANTANCNAVGDLTDVGSYMGSASPTGTFDQGGNVFEWNEAIIGSERGLRGGSAINSPLSLAASFRNGGVPTFENDFVGFRVASPVPEPGMGLLLMTGLLGLLGLSGGRRRRA